MARYEEEPPNGSRLSCGRNAGGRKAVEPQKKRLAGEATQFFRQAPDSFKRMLGCNVGITAPSPGCCRLSPP